MAPAVDDDDIWAELYGEAPPPEPVAPPAAPAPPIAAAHQPQPVQPQPQAPPAQLGPRKPFQHSHGAVALPGAAAAAADDDLEIVLDAPQATRFVAPGAAPAEEDDDDWLVLDSSNNRATTAAAAASKPVAAGPAAPAPARPAGLVVRPPPKQRGLDARLLSQRLRDFKVDWTLPPAWPSEASDTQPIKLPRQAKVTQEEYQQFLALGHGEIFSLDVRRTCVINNRGELQNPPWRMAGVDLNDYFNYGMNEQDWIEYCLQVEQFRLQYSLQHNDPSVAASTPIIDEDEEQLPPAKRGGMAHPLMEYDPDHDHTLLPGGLRRPRDPHLRPVSDSLEVTTVLFQPTFPCDPAPMVIDYGYWDLFTPLGMHGITDFPKYHVNPEVAAMQRQAMVAMAQQVQRNLESAGNVLGPGELKMADGAGMMGEDFMEHKPALPDPRLVEGAAALQMMTQQAMLRQMHDGGAADLLDYNPQNGFAGLGGGEDLMGVHMGLDALQASAGLPRPMLSPLDYANGDASDGWRMDEFQASQPSMMDVSAAGGRHGGDSFDYDGGGNAGTMDASFGSADAYRNGAFGRGRDERVDGADAQFSGRFGERQEEPRYGGRRGQSGDDVGGRWRNKRDRDALEGGGGWRDERRGGRGQSPPRRERDSSPPPRRERVADGRDRDRDGDDAFGERPRELRGRARGARDADGDDADEGGRGFRGRHEGDEEARRGRLPRGDLRDALRSRHTEPDRDREQRPPRADDSKGRDLRFRGIRGQRGDAAPDGLGDSPGAAGGRPERSSRGGGVVDRDRKPLRDRAREREPAETRPAGVDLREWLRLKGGRSGSGGGGVERGGPVDRSERYDPDESEAFERRGREERGRGRSSDRDRARESSEGRGD